MGTLKLVVGVLVFGLLAFVVMWNVGWGIARGEWSVVVGTVVVAFLVGAVVYQTFVNSRLQERLQEFEKKLPPGA
jgi:hypothetical protein